MMSTTYEQQRLQPSFTLIKEVTVMFWKLIETTKTTASIDAQSKSEQPQFSRRYVTMFSRISNLFIVCIMLIVVGVVQQVSAVEIEAGTWAQKADMPTGRYIAGSAVVDGKIYVIGGAAAGVGGTAVIEEYDPAADTWTTRADMPTARDGIVAAAVDGIIYAIGGWPEGSNIELSTVEAYDPATDTWTTKADMPTARRTTAACVVDGRIYVFGGNASWDLLEILPTVEVYDPATDTWTQASDMPRNRSNHTASVVDGKMYIIGGAVWPEAFMSPVVFVYDPATDTWTTAADLPTPRWDPTANVVDGKIYTIGGRIGEEAAYPNLSPVSTVEEFDPGLPGVISSVSPAGKLLETWGQIKKVQ